MEKTLNVLIYEFRNKLDTMVNEAYSDGIPSQTILDSIDIVRNQLISYTAKLCEEDMQKYIEQKGDVENGKTMA